LVVFLDLSLNFADVLVLGANRVADHLRIGGGDVAYATGHSH